MKLETSDFKEFKLSPNFKMSEFKCKCGCSTFKLDSELIDKLQALRVKVGKPVRILSAYRCVNHNRSIGGATNSQHLYGTAADIAITGMTVDQIAKAAEEVGFDGIGKYPKQNFVHCDVRGNRARWTE